MVFLAAFAVLALQTPDTARIVVVATSDLHGQAVAWDFGRRAPASGALARAATAIDSLRHKYPDQVVVVDAGDALEGNPFATYYGEVEPQDPHPIIDAMNQVGYDAATVGNHDFDFGVPLLDRAISAATFPFVSANIRVVPDDTLELRSYVVLQRNGIRVGITGFTTTGVMVWNRDQLHGRLRVTPMADESSIVLGEMRKDADLAIVLSHSGMEGMSSYDTTGVGAENVAAKLAEGSVRPDLVVVGHSHREMVDSIRGGVHFVQPKPFGQSLAVVHVLLTRRSGAWRVTSVRAGRVLLDKVPPSERLERRLAEKQVSVSTWMSETIGEAKGFMRAATGRVEDTSLIRFITDVERRVANAELASTPISDIRAGFDTGEITIGDVFQISPSENTLRAIRISGEGLRSYLEQSARYWFVDSTGRVFTNAYVSGPNYDVIGGAEYTVDLSRPAGSRITELSVRGKAVQPTDSFTLALGSLRQAGEGNYSMLRDAPVLYDRGERIRDLLINEVRRRKELDPAAFAGSSWKLVPDSAALAARALFVRPGTPAAGATTSSAPPVLSTVAAANDTPELYLAPADETVATMKLPASAGPGGSLLRLMSDAYRSSLRADLAIVAASEGAQDLNAGNVGEQDLRAAVPGGDQLLKLSIRGDDLRWILEHVVEGETPCCEISGATLTYAPSKPALQRVRSVRFASGRELEPKVTYQLVISRHLVQGDFFTLGGTKCAPGVGCVDSGLLGHWPLTESDLTGTDAMREYLHRLPQPVVPPESSRLLPAR
jgi:2',3'-cyclic-nucleotide 2'-phosphodiesterase (5'-nucleotidase family)